MKKGLQDIRLVSGKTHEDIELPEEAALIYPGLDRVAQDDLDQEAKGKGPEDESVKDKWKGAGKGIIKKILQQDVLYLLIVNLPWEYVDGLYDGGSKTGAIGTIVCATEVMIRILCGPLVVTDSWNHAWYSPIRPFNAVFFVQTAENQPKDKLVPALQRRVHIYQGHTRCSRTLLRGWLG